MKQAFCNIYFSYCKQKAKGISKVRHERDLKKSLSLDERYLLHGIFLAIDLLYTYLQILRAGRDYRCVDRTFAF